MLEMKLYGWVSYFVKYQFEFQIETEGCAGLWDFNGFQSKICQNTQQITLVLKIVNLHVEHNKFLYLNLKIYFNPFFSKIIKIDKFISEL